MEFQGEEGFHPGSSTQCCGVPRVQLLAEVTARATQLLDKQAQICNPEPSPQLLHVGVSLCSPPSWTPFVRRDLCGGTCFAAHTLYSILSSSILKNPGSAFLKYWLPALGTQQLKYRLLPPALFVVHKVSLGFDRALHYT